MWTARYLSILALVVIPISGAAQMPVVPVPEEDGQRMTIESPDSCDAASYQYLIGRHGDAARALTLDQPVRVIPPGAAVTLDFRANRINFELDDAGNVVRIYCG